MVRVRGARRRGVANWRRVPSPSARRRPRGTARRPRRWCRGLGRCHPWWAEARAARRRSRLGCATPGHSDRPDRGLQEPPRPVPGDRRYRFGPERGWDRRAADHPARTAAGWRARLVGVSQAGRCRVRRLCLYPRCPWRRLVPLLEGSARQGAVVAAACRCCRVAQREAPQVGSPLEPVLEPPATSWTARRRRGSRARARAV